MRLLLLALAVLFAGCSPVLDWREVQGPTGLAAMLPCKPDRGEREVMLGDRKARLQMVGCEAGGATFALALIDAGDAASALETAQRWEAAALQNMRGKQTAAADFRPAGAGFGRRVSATGQIPDGSAVRSEAAYFGRGAQVYQAVIYAGRMPTDAADPFFAGLKLP